MLFAIARYTVKIKVAVANVINSIDSIIAEAFVRLSDNATAAKIIAIIKFIAATMFLAFIKSFISLGWNTC